MDLREMPAPREDRPSGQSGSRHPWERARARFFCGQLAPHLRPGIRVLDIGAGDGYLVASLLPAIQPGGSVVCFDTGYSDQHLARFAAAAPAGQSFTRELPESQFDLVLMLDVLEHVPDDHAFLASVTGNTLAAGGVLLASVPAHPLLFTRHDVNLGHHRRYRPPELPSLLRDAGLDVEATGGLFHSLLPIRMAQKLGEILGGVWTRPVPDAVSGHAHTGLSAWKGNPWVGRVLVRMLSLDNRISAASARCKLGVPGLSAWALARKP